MTSNSRVNIYCTYNLDPIRFLNFLNFCIFSNLGNKKKFGPRASKDTTRRDPGQFGIEFGAAAGIQVSSKPKQRPSL